MESEVCNEIYETATEKLKSVASVNPLRSKFKKSHTCGSLFVKCDCKLASPVSSQSLSAGLSSLQRDSSRQRQFFQSYSHPDTPHIFTNDNKVISQGHLAASQNDFGSKKSISTRNGAIEISSETKRLSSPNIGNYAIIDVAIHPEIRVTVKKNIPKKPALDKSFSTPNSEDVTSEKRTKLFSRRTRSESTNLQSRDDIDECDGDGRVLAKKSEVKSDENLSYCNNCNRSNESNSNSENNLSIPNDVDQVDSKTTANNIEYLGCSAISYQNEAIKIANATKFLQESGILGPITMGNGLVKKNSKIQDTTHIIEQVRRSSKAYLNKQQALQQYEFDDKIKSYQDEIGNLKVIVKNRDDEINNLKREIDKLKSVLQKTVEPTLTSPKHNRHNQDLGSLYIENKNNLNNLIKNTTISNDNHTNHHSNNTQTLLKAPAQKKQGVSAESCDISSHRMSEMLITKYEKDFLSKHLIKEAIMDNGFLKSIDSTQMRELVDSMYSREVKRDEYVIREGETGAHLYVAADGKFNVFKDGEPLGQMGPGKAFGELAILYNCTRTASVRALENSHLWVLDRRVFQQIMMRTGMQRIEENINFLRSVPLLKNLSHDVLTKIADVLEVEFYPAGAYIIRQGASGDTFYLISQGNVQVTQKLADRMIEDEIRTLGRGDYFGEQALIKEDKRTANIIALSPGVECLTLDRTSFTQLIGDLCELHEKDYGDHERVFACKRGDFLIPTLERQINDEYLDIQLNDLVTVATLGLGGFGRVELVKHLKGGEIKPYALKCLKKQHIVDTRQEDHIFSERTIMLSCDSPFICRLFRTFSDNKYVYMLLEACLGGEVWTILRDRGCFDDYTTQFIIGCVLQAFDYLHARGIVYRDLKPENLMLDSNGYVKLVDFGFAKYIGYSSKTWTFCGTPEYVAPEIILNKGHDRAVDYWALGVLIHELLTGKPPFTASDPMETYNIILRGIDMVDFRNMSRSAISLIKRLCRDVPAERLGYQRGGIQEIKKHKWFQSFDWDGLENLTLMPPIDHPVQHNLDTTYFDSFPMDNEIPPDETSGWDADF